MPNVAKGEVRFSGGVWRTRVTLKGKLRHDVELPHALDEEQALERAAVLSEQAQLLRKAGKAETMAARSLLTAMGAEAELGPEAFAVVARLCGATGDPLAARGGGMTFKQLGEKWTGDELATDYPDSVPHKQSKHDKTRLEYLYKVDVGGVRLGDVALTRFTLEHGEAVKRSLPKTAKRRAGTICKSCGVCLSSPSIRAGSSRSTRCRSNSSPALAHSRCIRTCTPTSLRRCSRSTARATTAPCRFAFASSGVSSRTRVAGSRRRCSFASAQAWTSSAVP